MSVMKLQNVWVPSMKTKSAKMGGQEQLALLARVLDRVIQKAPVSPPQDAIIPPLKPDQWQAHFIMQRIVSYCIV
jgi:hypothetical protein